MSFRKLLITLSGVAIVFGLTITLGWAIMDTGIHLTSEHEFCSSCHSHKPIGTSYRASEHGGNNPAGWRATCSDCHINHDNALTYLWVKGVHGVVDPTMELLKDSYDIDWHGNRERRKEYVYDSGCLQCHKYLEEASQGSAKAFRPHRKYFAREEPDLQCVDCHEHVGHDNLGLHLQEHGWEKTQ